MENWTDFDDHELLARLIEIEEQERCKRCRRSLERRLERSKIGAFKSIADFDCGWPSKIDRSQVEDVLRLDFCREPANVIIVGPKREDDHRTQRG